MQASLFDRDATCASPPKRLGRGEPAANTVEALLSRIIS